MGKNKFRKNQLIVAKKTLFNCGCAVIEKGTIAKVSVSKADKDGDIIGLFSKHETNWRYIDPEDFRPLTDEEKKYAKDRFALANTSKYATVD